MTDSVQEDDVMLSAPLLGDLTYREWHAVVDGFYSGYRGIDVDGEEYQKEKHYWRVGWLVGDWIGVGEDCNLRHSRRHDDRKD
jgi:hypothetical protein